MLEKQYKYKKRVSITLAFKINRAFVSCSYAIVSNFQVFMVIGYV